MGRSLEEIKLLSEVFNNLQTGIKKNIAIERLIEDGLNHLSIILNDELLELKKTSNPGLNIKKIQQQ